MHGDTVQISWSDNDARELTEGYENLNQLYFISRSSSFSFLFSKSDQGELVPFKDYEIVKGIIFWHQSISSVPLPSEAACLISWTLWPIFPYIRVQGLREDQRVKAKV